MSNASSLYMTQVTGKEPNSFHLQSKLIELKVISSQLGLVSSLL